MVANQSISKPCIFIQVAPHVGYEKKLREITAGMEEEGIPCVVAKSAELQAAGLAHQAAVQSQLGVGVGVNSEEICIHYAKLPPEAPLFRSKETANPLAWRLLGYNAARLVKGIPFKTLSPEPVISAVGEAKGQSDSMALYHLVSSIVSQVLQESAHGHGEV